jgi:hypothetical protein
MARRLLAGSLDRAVDVAATLELRGYSLEPQPAPKHSHRRLIEAFSSLWRGKSFSERSRFDGRFYVIGGLVLAAALVGKFVGADAFSAYPTVEVGFAPSTLALSVLLLFAGLAPLRRKPRRPARSLAAPTRAPAEASRA